MLWVLIIMGLIFFFQTFDLSSSDEVSYDQYRRYLENQQIQKIIYTQDIMPGLFKIPINMQKYANGIYFIKIMSEDLDSVKKIIKQ